MRAELPEQPISPVKAGYFYWTFNWCRSWCDIVFLMAYLDNTVKTSEDVKNIWSTRYWHNTGLWLREGANYFEIR